MSRYPVGRLVTTAYIALLNDNVSWPVGDGQMPDGAGWQGAEGASDFTPYAVVHSISGGITDGTLHDPDEDGYFIYQVNGIGVTRAQCELVADTCREVTLTMPLTVDGRSVAQVRVDMLGGSRRDDTASSEPPLWLAVDRYRIVTTPLSPVD